ncbi:MAG: YceI family protein [Chloroflexota bacterium]|nr:YceI family protein [Dehalococcoidia bacterium]MDW8046743.1 YceI family protein [Chloroflexota bacterium]
MWKLDKAHTNASFAVKHMLVTTVRGRFTNVDADVDIDEQDLTKSRATVTIDVASIDTGEPQRDAHLRSADFFDVEKFPKMTFVTRSIERVGEGKYRITGDLTIKDVTKPVTFEAEVVGPTKNPWGMEVLGIAAEAKVNRKDWGLTWNAPLEFGGWLIGDEVRLNFDAELVKQPAEVPAGS